MKVTVLVETWKPRPKLRGVGLTKKLYPALVPVGEWPVLYCDRDDVVVKQFDAIAIYEPTTGRATLAGFRRTHPAAKRIPEKRGWFRLAPASIEVLKKRRALR